MICRKCHAEIPENSVYCNLCGVKQEPEKRKALKRPNGTGTVYKLQGRRHRPWVAAKNRVIIGYYETKTAATEALNRLSGRDLSDRYNMTFAEVFKEWKSEHYKDITESGQTQYDISYQVFKPLHNKKFRDLKTADFQSVLNPHMKKAYSTVAKYKQLITQMSKWAMREEIITINLASYVKLPENTKTEKVIFTDEEIKIFEDKATTNETAKIVCMLLSTGMRIGELFSVKLEDYHGDYVIGGSKSDAGKNRVIPIRPEGREHFAYFAKYAEVFLLDGYVGNKDAHNFRNRDYSDLIKQLGIDKKKTPHTTRHTYASRAVKEGVAPEVLQKILGHADYATTANIYTHLDIDTLIDAVNKTSETENSK